MPNPAQSPQDTTAASGQTLADVLFSEKVITDAQLEKVKLEQVNTGRSLEEILAEEGIAVSDIVKAKAKLLGTPYVNLAETAVSPEALNLIPKSVSERYKILPVSLDAETNELSLAMADPLDAPAIEFAEKKSGKKIKPLMADPDKIEQAIETAYAQSLSTEVTAALEETAPAEEVKMVDIARLGEVIREAPVAKIVATVLEFAIRSRASDVHIEPMRDKTRVRYRIDGILHEKLVLPKKVHEALVSRIKILSDLKIDERRIPQDGRFNFRAAGQEVDLRVSTMPSTNGEKVVMRLLKKTGGVPTLPELGLRGKALKDLEKSILVPHGIIIICGPTGSGKTTTLYSILTKISTIKVNITTVEDPVEYEIAGVTQVQVNPQAGLTFAAGMRNFLRQDPDIIMVGEIRDAETAALAIQAALTGHLVFSTLHTNDASGALPRLMDMKAEPFLLASSMTLLLAQRVVRRICTHCKEDYEPPKEVVEDVKEVLEKLLPPEQDKKMKLYRGRGCKECSDSGYSGRIGIFEVMPISDKLSRMILERPAAVDIINQGLEEGMVTMKQDGYLKALEGITTIEEVLRVAQT